MIERVLRNHQSALPIVARRHSRPKKMTKMESYSFLTSTVHICICKVIFNGREPARVIAEGGLI